MPFPFHAFPLVPLKALASVFLLLSCRDNALEMQLTVVQRIPLDKIPSASGIELLDHQLYIIGDDSPWLHIMDTNYQLTGRRQIIESEDSVRIPKLSKPDFEALAQVSTPEGPRLLLFGSGSKSPEREVLIIADPDGKSPSRSFPLAGLYAHLRFVSGLQKTDFNIEAAATNLDDLYLFNRGINMVFVMSYQQVMDYLEKNASIPSIRVVPVSLPKMEGAPSGFSGATWVPELEGFLFTASVEKTINWIDDGPVVGSYIGLLPLSKLEAGVTPLCEPISSNGEILPIKVESLVVLEASANGSFRLILVTDPDGGVSELLEVELNYL